MGFEELPHTADCALRVWAPDLTSLFGEAALGFNFISGARLASDARVTRRISLSAADGESLLVAFLTELLYIQEQETVGFDRFHLQVSDKDISGHLVGARLISLSRPIKAITFHNLVIHQIPCGHEVEIVFDV
jgi:SHS2 domain-containing protein